MNGKALLAVVVSYLLGSIPAAYIAGKAKGIDLRKHGSGNLGATNVMRVLGPKIALDALPREGAAFDAQLAAAAVTLSKDGAVVDRGVGANVLDGPLHALAHFLVALRDCPGATDLQPGDVVTTGTWTDAWPVHRGETWRATFGAPLPSLGVHFS